MKSIKPGRGPSKRNFVGSIFSIVFGIIWTVIAFCMAFESVGAGFGFIGLLFPLFGIVFIGLGVYNAIVNYKNANGEDRMSLYDIVDSQEEPDPWSPNYERKKGESRNAPAQGEGSFCPYCGKPVEQDHRFCKYCGRSLR